MDSSKNGIKKIYLANQEFLLHFEKAIYWKKEQMLIVTDIHLGKSGHFRKSGIAAPSAINSKNIERLTKLVNEFNPVELLILGDLFHSSINREWMEFENWRDQFPKMQVTLVTGNHDILHHSFYQSGNIQTSHFIEKGEFTFVHDIEDKSDHESITFSGHIHPAIAIKSKGRQTLKVPCFLIRKNHVLLPAFGEFTGTHLIKPEETDSVYCVVDKNVISLNLKQL